MLAHAPRTLLLSSFLLLAACGANEEETRAAPAATTPPPAPSSLPAAPPRVLLFGDLHIHTSLSADAFSTGVRALPDEAYRYAKGEEVLHGAGYPTRLKRALDLAYVTYHA